MPDESPQDRVNRELIELLNELRVALPGVQVLFAFLLAVPFSNGFSKLSSGDRRVYLAAVLLTAISTAFLIAPSSFHRLRWRAKDKERMLVVSNYLTIVGLLLLAAAITCTVFFITDFVFHIRWAAAFTAVVALVFVVLWYGLPLYARLSAARRAR